MIVPIMHRPSAAEQNLSGQRDQIAPAAPLVAARPAYVKYLGDGMKKDSLLLVDDDRQVLESMAGWLRDQGYQVDTAGGHAEALVSVVTLHTNDDGGPSK
jgi:hypothetical protein